MPLHLHGPAALPDDDQGGDVEPAELLYDTIGSAIRGCPEATLIALLGAIQRGDRWARLPPHVRAVFVELAAEVYGDDEEEG